MYFHALATDYDGTLARDGVVYAATCMALRRFKAGGRRLVLVTGRELPDLARVFPALDLFDRVVAENGALLFNPATGRERVLGTAPPERFVQRLRSLGVEPMSVGRAIVATWEPHQGKVLEAIRELGLEWQIVFNKGAVMVLPSGINKETGLAAALDELGLSINNAVGVGDAENDHAFLSASGCSAAVANALDGLKAEVDIVLRRDHGAGVVELIDRIIADDARLAAPPRHGLCYGELAGGGQAVLVPQGGNVLVTGATACGKTTLAIALSEEMAAKGFEFAVIDPESDYEALAHAVAIGTERVAPVLAEAIQILGDAKVNLVVCTQAMSLGERQAFLAGFLGEAAALRARTGRPHWIVVDEAHQVLPSGGEAASRFDAIGVDAAILVTLSPQQISHRVLASVGTVLAIGTDAPLAVEAVAGRLGIAPPVDMPAPAEGQLLRWLPRVAEARPALVDIHPCAQPHLRHRGKYALGDLGPWRSFYFRGPARRLNRAANNLYSFIEAGAEVGDEVWAYHLHAGDYASWFRDVIKDEDLARLAEILAADAAMTPGASREAIAEAVRERYAGPADESWRQGR
ncbi:phosphoglycolate phosphatase [Acuticoccus sediminis]|uniref:Phosphoglycolate phosphatase n=1 Tax=Acuticoccus sediminis TaxID=2184697 RepID=A0A8B2NYN0_9HYPH|nr:HAD-IIB family hydrolase [Acuticoccus sediminis]RAI03820.1 phosphoglycolate phosphatase [Acuticoccus sediminis]